MKALKPFSIGKLSFKKGQTVSGLNAEYTARVQALGLVETAPSIPAVEDTAPLAAAHNGVRDEEDNTGLELPDVKPIEEMTARDLKAELDALGKEYSSRASKADLVELYRAAIEEE